MEEYPYPPEYGMPVPAGMGMFDAVGQQDPDLVKWQLEVKDEILRFFNVLLGRRWEKEGKKYIKDENAEPICNEKGANILVTNISTHVSKISIMSNLSENEINRVCRHLKKMLGNLVAQRYDDWGLKRDFFDFAVNNICDIVFFGLLRAKDEGERRYHKQTHRFIETKHLTPMGVEEARQKKGRLWNIFG